MHTNMPDNTSYPVRVLIALDQFANVVTGGLIGETISARTGRKAADGALWARALKAILNRIQSQHTENAELHDLQRDATVVRTEEDALHLQDK